MIKGQRHCVAAAGEHGSAVANIRSYQPQRTTTVVAAAAAARAAATTAATAAAAVAAVASFLCGRHAGIVAAAHWWALGPGTAAVAFIVVY